MGVRLYPMRFDLHTHTICSDGNFTPEQLIDAARQQGLELLALTDHDTLNGLERTRTLAGEAGLRFIPGTELSTTWQGHSTHLLGYFPCDWRLDGTPARDFLQWLQRLRERRHNRNEMLAESLRKHGIPFQTSYLSSGQTGGSGEPPSSTPAAATPGQAPRQFGRPHIARWLTQHGYADSVADAFQRYLLPGTPTYVRLDGARTEEAIEAIHAAGGRASLAHPGRFKFSWQPSLPELVRAGLDGLECWHSSHTTEQAEAYQRLARQLGLRVSGGSDFHGREGEQPGGVAIPDGVLNDWADLGIEVVPRVL